MGDPPGLQLGAMKHVRPQDSVNDRTTSSRDRSTAVKSADESRAVKLKKAIPPSSSGTLRALQASIYRKTQRPGETASVSTPFPKKGRINEDPWNEHARLLKSSGMVTPRGGAQH